MVKSAETGVAVTGRLRKHLSAVMPRRRARLLTTVFGVVVGASAGILYARAVSTHVAWTTLSIGGLGGVALGYLAVALPRVALHYLLREWYRTVAGHWSAVVRQRAERARRHLQRDSTAGTAAHDLGVASYLLGREGEAAEQLRHASTERHPPTLNALAVAEATRGEWQQALDALATALSAQLDYTAGLHNLVVMLAQMPHASSLPDALVSAVERAGAGALNNVAVRQMLEGDQASARAHLQSALAQQPQHAAAHANLGVAAYYEGDVDTAVTSLAAAAQFAPIDVDILSSVGAVSSVTGGYRVAETVLKRAHKLDARHLPSIINYACLLLQTDRIDDAAETLAALPSDHRLAATAAYNAAVAWAAAKEWGRAHEYAEKALAIQPDDPRVLATVGAILWHLRNYEEADRCLSRAVELAPAEPQILGSAIRAALSAGRETIALELLEKLSEVRWAEAPDDDFDAGVGWLLTALKRRKDEMNRTEHDLYKAAVRRAAVAFEKVIAAKHGPIGQALINLGLADYMLEEYEVAGEHFQASVRLLDDPEAHFCAGTAFAVAGFRVQADRGTSGDLVPEARQLLRRARQQLTQAAEHHTASADVYSNLGTVCYQLGHTEDALKALKRLVQLEASAAANNNLALAFARQGQELIHQAHVKRTTGQRTSEVLNTARRLISSAVHYFTQALQFDPLNPVLHSNMGLAYMLRNGPGDLENALHHWHRMRAAGDEWAEQQFARLMQVMENQQTARAQFHDVGQALRTLDVPAYVRLQPPAVGAPVYIVEPVMESGLWELEATHRDLQIALRARRRLELLQQRLQRLLI